MSSARRIVMILLVLFLLASIPVLFYFWARTNGQPAPIPALNRLLPRELRLRELPNPAKLNVEIVQEPLNGTECFFANSYACVFSAISTESGRLRLQDTSYEIPNFRYHVGQMLADKGALYEHYQSSLYYRTEPQPVYNAILDMHEQSEQHKITPMFLWAYYDFVYAKAKELGVSPTEIGLNENGIEFSPPVEEVASTLAVSAQMFQTDGAFGELQPNLDELAQKLNQTSMSQTGKTVVYATAQLFGPDFTEQVFATPGSFGDHYDRLFRDRDELGEYTVVFAGQPLDAASYYDSANDEFDFVLCHGNQPYACRAPGPLAPGMEGGAFPERQASCSQVKFLEYFCMESSLPVVE